MKGWNTGRNTGMIAGMVLAAGVLTGCVSTRVPYTARTDASRPQETIQRVIMEQDEGNRPGSINVTSEYVEFSKGTDTRVNPFGRASSKEGVTRLYYSSVHGEIYTKRNDVIVLMRNKTGSVLAAIITGSKEDGRDLVDAMATMRERETNASQ